ncbi:MAG: LysR family transcriptional regulator [Oscillospiraceae bacterium]
MDTVKLRALLAAADCGSLSGAAERLGYTQSGLTHMMNALENEAGMTLLLRGNRGVRLSADGERLAPLMRELLTCDERLEEELALTRGLERGRVSIGSYSSMSLHWLPGILEAFQSKYPDIEVEILEGNGTEIEDWLTSGRIDLAFTSLQPYFTFETIEVMEDPMLAVLPLNHPMAGEKVFPVEKFKGEQLLLYTTPYRLDEDLARTLKQAGLSARAKFTSNFDQTVISMVEHNQGVAIMPSLILEGLNARVATVPLYPHMSRKLGIALRGMKDASPALRRFIDCAKDFLLSGRAL